MNSLNKLITAILFIASVLNLGAQTIGETIADTSSNFMHLNNDTQIIRHRNDDQGTRMVSSILWDQSELVNYSGQGFGGANVSATTGLFFGINVNTSGNYTLADDIIVLPGEKWVIDSIVFFNYQTGSTTTSTINDIRLQIINGNAPGTGAVVFGDLTTNVLNSTSFSGIYRTLPSSLNATNRPIMRSKVVLSELNLFAGTYWLEHQVNGSLSTGPFSPLRTLGTSHIITGNGYQYNSNWNLINELDNNGNNPLNKGIAFIVYGISLPFKAAKVNGIDYNTLQEAIDAITNDGDEVTLLMDVTESDISITNYSAIFKADGYSCNINNLNIPNGKYFRWLEDTLTITGSINNNTSGILINNGTIMNSTFTNTGIYKGTGSFIGNLINQNIVAPGNE